MKDQAKLAASAIITFLIFFIELFGGIFFNSLSLLSDSFHVLIDVTALLVSLIALKIALRDSCGKKYTYGYHRLEVFAAIINAAILSIAIFTIVQEAINRFFFQEPIDVIPTLIASIIGITANILAILILRNPHSHHEDVNVKSAFYHVIGDTLASVGVIIGTLIIFFTNFYWIDPIIALLIAGILTFSVFRILRSSLRILMQGSPIDIRKIENLFLEIEEIVGIHDLHFWKLCSNISILTAHVCTTKTTLEEFSLILDRIKMKLKKKYEHENIYPTIQFEKPGGECNCKLEHKEDFTCTPRDKH
ncbi:MAG: cation diffusion facilitator family transporter [Candidatus Lokiarchaeota archaeon]|nr:cation diffusion facilitator family transporter [Candidatus Lokiarchaeota archaeon]